MPELYCGFDRRPQDRHPARYPVACSPQAWAAGALPYALTSLLGLEPDALEGSLYVRDPCLPAWLSRLTVRHMRIGDATLDITFARQGSEIDVDFQLHHGELRIERVGAGRELATRRGR